nr:hypothetical protein [Candidatus Sigynarchaeota archaeon]
MASKEGPPIVTLSAGDACYVCGRKPEELRAFFKNDAFISKIQRGFDDRKKRTQDMKEEYLKSLRELHSSVQSYPESVTPSELRKNDSLAQKLAPRYKDLIPFAFQPNRKEGGIRSSSRSIEEVDLTIGQLRDCLFGFIQSTEKNEVGRISDVNPRLANLIRDYLLNEQIIRYELISEEMMQTKFQTRRIRARFDFAGNIVGDQRHRDHHDFRYPESGDKVDSSDVVMIELVYKICPICSTLFSSASNAAFSEIHRNDDDD